jgi:hypothetical protein
MQQSKFLITLTDAQKAALDAAFDTIENILSFKVILSAEERQKKRKMGIKRYGIVTNTYNAAIGLPEAIPASSPIENFSTKLALYEDLRHCEIRVSSLHQSIRDTNMALGCELMSDSENYYSFLKTANKAKVAADSVVENIASGYKRKPKSKPLIYTIGIKGHVTIEKVATGTKLVNTGDAIIMFRPADGYTGNQNDPKLVDPESSVTIPKGWINITVINQSETSEATVSVRMRK